MNHIEIIQNCQVCQENSTKRGFLIRYTFKLCDKCTKALDASKSETNVSEWDKPWYSADWVEPKQAA